MYVAGSTVVYVQMHSRYVLMVLEVQGHDLLVSNIFVAKVPHPPPTKTHRPATGKPSGKFIGKPSGKPSGKASGSAGG
jgi:hypothetical protein